ncbi:unnamed protein product [Blepharisma stoltei]|uniref:RING-type domain-containing protein n=1 Tax=Blepharisma stoltei TaxID=1481888 RepID=A0AAU9JRP2_9CILI|nr:unnamed protein product [Blepharisma stoltei]
MDNDCSILCILCALKGVISVNYAGFHKVCNTHSEETNVGTELNCKHCNSRVKIICLKQIPIPTCGYCEQKEGIYQIPACKHRFCVDCFQTDANSYEDWWFCPICKSYVESPAPFFRTQRELEAKQKNAPIAKKDPKINAKNNKAKKEVFVPEKGSHEPKNYDLPDISCVQKKNTPIINEGNNKGLGESDLPGISNFQNLQTSGLDLPDISVNPSSLQNLVPNAGFNLQYQQAEDLPDINPTDSFLRGEKEELIDSSVNVPYRPAKKNDQPNLSWKQNDQSEFEEISDKFLKNSKPIELKPLEPELCEIHHEIEIPVAEPVEPAQIDELVMQCTICYSWYLEIIDNGASLYCGHCKSKFCPICLIKLENHEKCREVREISRSSTFGRIYEINLKLDQLGLVVQKCPNCYWLQTYDRTDPNFDNYGTCRNEKCKGKKFCLLCTGDPNPNHDCLNEEKLKKEIKYHEIRGYTFPKSFFEKRFHK